jgi:subtilase family serine protease
LTIEGGVTGVGTGTFVGGTKGGKATVKVFNRGAATAAGMVAVTFYASADGTLDAGDMALVTVNKKVNLKVGKNAAFTGKFNYPLGIADGPYFILAKADSADAITESDETNNVSSSAGTIGIAAPFVDLNGTSLVGKGVFKAGKNGTTALTVNNGGNVTASATITFQLFLSPDNVAGNGDDVLVGTLSKHIKLKAGGTTNIALKGNLASVLPGSYHLVSVIDSTNVLTESDETNNSVLGSLVTVL